MKYIVTLFLYLSAASACAQSLQLHYDLRGAIDPKHNPKNYPTLFYEHFKSTDSGSFLLKMQTDLVGDKNNIGKFFMQVSRSVCFWKPKLFLQFEYSGGLGVTEPKEYSYYITNAFSLGAGHPFQWKGGYFNIYACYTYSPLKKNSHDILFSFYWWKGFFNYKLECSGDFEIYTRNKNTGDANTVGLTGKRVSFFAEPQFWYKIYDGVSIGTKVNWYYHVLITDPVLQVYPTIGIKCKI